MFGYKKKHNNNKHRSHLHTTMMNFNPFMADTKYLEHLHKAMKLRNTREAMLMFRKDMIEGNKRANYQNELDRVQNELYRPNLSRPSKRTFGRILYEIEKTNE